MHFTKDGYVVTPKDVVTKNPALNGQCGLFYITNYFPKYVLDAVAAPPSAPSANSSAAVGSVKANANGSKVKAASSNVKVTNGSAAGARGSGSKSTIKKEEGGKSGQFSCKYIFLYQFKNKLIIDLLLNII